MQRAWRSLRTYQFVFHWGISSQSICNYLSHVPRLLSIIQRERERESPSISLSLFPRLSGSLIRFECGPWVDISIGLAQLLWLSILKLLLVFLSRLLIPQRSLLPSLSLSLSRSPFVSSRHLEIVTSYGCDRRLSIRIVCRQSSIHLISFFRNNKKRKREADISR